MSDQLIVFYFRWNQLNHAQILDSFRQFLTIQASEMYDEGPRMKTPYFFYLQTEKSVYSTGCC